MRRFPVRLGKNVIQLNRNSQILALLREMYGARKIILHSLFPVQIVLLLAVQPWLLKKCYWVMWGGDLYHRQFRPRGFKSDVYEAIRAFVIKRMGHFVTYFKGEYDLARLWYGAKGKHHECFTYPSNIYQRRDVKTREHDAIHIQVGNSATDANCHLEVLEKLSVYKDRNIRIFVPLSYGDNEYASKVIAFGNSVFGDKFIPMLDFLPFGEYLRFLSEVDIAIFNHNRQQAIGNIVTLLGMGKKVYMCTDVTSWDALQQLGLHVFDVNHLDLSPLSATQAEENARIVSAYFSEANLTAQLSAIFESADPEGSM